KEEGASWHEAGTGKLCAAVQLGKAIEAEAAGKPAEASAWWEAAGENQSGSEHYARAAEAYSIGTPEKKEEGGSWHNAGAGKLRAAAQLEKAIEAEAANNTTLAQAWREAARENQSVSEYYRKAAEARAIGTPEKKEEGASWHEAGTGKLCAAVQLGKAIEAEAAGKSVLAQAWREAVGENRSASEHYARAAEAYSIGTPEKKEEGKSWHEAGCGKYRAAEQLSKAIEANNPEVAQAWREAAAENQSVSEYYRKAAEARAIGTPEKKEEGASWHEAGTGKLCAAVQLGKAIEAEAAGKPAVASAWRVAAAENQSASDYYVKAAEAKAIDTPEKTSESTSLHNAGRGKLRAAEQLARAIEAEAANNPAIASAWRAAAAQNQLATKDFIRAARKHAAGKSSRFFGKGGDAWDRDGQEKLRAAEELAKAIPLP
ncbi:MAG: hypothetical protein ACH346_05660, partial [Chthoniobacterales bacterium]